MDFVLVIKGVEKMDISETLTYQFFDNATVSVLIGSLVVSILGIITYTIQKRIDRREYLNQKEIDRLESQKKIIVEDISLLEQKLAQVDVSFEKTINSEINFRKGKFNISKENFENSQKKESTKISKLIGDAIEIVEKNHSLIHLYFDKEIDGLNNNLYLSFRRWYSDIAEGKLTLEENRKKIKKDIDKLIDAIQSVKELKTKI